MTGGGRSAKSWSSPNNFSSLRGAGTPARAASSLHNSSQAETSDMLLYLAGVNELAVLHIVGSKAMERSTLSEDNSVLFRMRSSLLSNLMLLYEP
jgi:hypothetical protein